MSKQTTLEVLTTKELLEEVKNAVKYSTKGIYQRGISSHHTVTETGYRIGDFHHAADAHLLDIMHNYAPQLISALEALVNLEDTTNIKQS